MKDDIYTLIRPRSADDVARLVMEGIKERFSDGCPPYDEYLEANSPENVAKRIVAGERKAKWAPLINPYQYEYATRQTDTFWFQDYGYYVFDMLHKIMYNASMLYAATIVQRYPERYPDALKIFNDALIGGDVIKIENDVITVRNPDWSKVDYLKQDWAVYFYELGNSSGPNGKGLFDDGIPEDESENICSYTYDLVENFYDMPEYFRPPLGGSVLNDDEDITFSLAGYNQLNSILMEYRPDRTDAQKALGYVSRALDVMHDRGSLAMFFIQGGALALDAVSHTNKSGLMYGGYHVDDVARKIANGDYNAVSLLPDKRKKMTQDQFRKWFKQNVTDKQAYNFNYKGGIWDDYFIRNLNYQELEDMAVKFLYVDEPAYGCCTIDPTQVSLEKHSTIAHCFIPHALRRRSEI